MSKNCSFVLFCTIALFLPCFAIEITDIIKEAVSKLEKEDFELFDRGDVATKQFRRLRKTRRYMYIYEGLYVNVIFSNLFKTNSLYTFIGVKSLNCAVSLYVSLGSGRNQIKL